MDRRAVAGHADFRFVLDQAWVCNLWWCLAPEQFQPEWDAQLFRQFRLALRPSPQYLKPGVRDGFYNEIRSLDRKLIFGSR
jgi:hypothetical protein